MTNDYSTEAQEVADAMNAVYENKQTNKKNDISGDFSSDNTSYPTVKAAKSEFGTKVTSWNQTPSDSNYPSEKLTKETIDTKTITVEKQATAETGYASTYVIKQNGAQVGVKINIDKDRMLRSATYETVGSTPTTEESNAGMSAGAKYIKLVVNTADSDSASNIILPITDIFDLQRADNSTLVLDNGVYAVKTGGIDTAQLKDGAVTSDKIAAAVKNSWLTSSDVQSEIGAFASALAEAINPSS